MRDTVVGHRTKLRGYFHFRHLVLRHVKPAIRMFRGVGFAGADSGFVHDTHPLGGSSD